MPRLQKKSFASPDEVRPMPNAHADIVHVGETKVALARWEPGWRWSTDLKPLIGTDSCQVHHLGFAISGVLRVTTDDGQTLDITPNAIYEIPAGHDAFVVGDEPFVTVEWTSADVVAIPIGGSGERVLATLLFTDIVDSTATAGRLGDAAWARVLREHNQRLRRELNAHRGREVATTGDGFLAVFDSATRAVQCGLAMARSVDGMGIAIRVGVHTGEIEFVGSDVRGVAVHAAARVLSVAGSGEVFVSGTTRDLLEGSGLVVEEAGEYQLKGLSGARMLYRVSGPRAG